MLAPYSHHPHPHGVHVYAVRAISEATNDSALLLHISNFGAARARAMKSGSGAFDVDDFVARLITYMGGRKPLSPVGDEEEEDTSEYDAGGAPLDWERIGRRALAKSKRVPVMDFMCVSLFSSSFLHRFYDFGVWSLHEHCVVVVLWRPSFELRATSVVSIAQVSWVALICIVEA